MKPFQTEGDQGRLHVTLFMWVCHVVFLHGLSVEISFSEWPSLQHGRSSVFQGVSIFQREPGRNCILFLTLIKEKFHLAYNCFKVLC